MDGVKKESKTNLIETIAENDISEKYPPSFQKFSLPKIGSST
jgi:hypothetical protein